MKSKYTEFRKIFETRNKEENNAKSKITAESNNFRLILNGSL